MQLESLNLRLPASLQVRINEDANRLGVDRSEYICGLIEHGYSLREHLAHISSLVEGDSQEGVITELIMDGWRYREGVSQNAPLAGEERDDA